MPAPIKRCLVCLRIKPITSFEPAEETGKGHFGRSWVCNQCIENKVEVWKSLEILGYPDYEHSNLGRTKSFGRWVENAGRAKRRWAPERFLNPTNILRQGIVHVTLTDREGKQNQFGKGWLTLYLFIRPPLSEEQCRHFLDKDPTNNKLTNLRWGTQSQNMSDMTRHNGGVHPCTEWLNTPEVNRKKSENSYWKDKSTPQEMRDKISETLTGHEESNITKLKKSESHLKRNRQLREQGIPHHNQKTNKELVLQVLELLAQGLSQGQTAFKLNISQGLVSQISRGKYDYLSDS